MSTKDININHNFSYSNPTTAGGGKGPSAATPNLNKLAKYLEQSTANSGKKISGEVIKEILPVIMTAINRAINKDGHGKGASISTAAIERLIKQTITETSRQLMVQASKAYGSKKAGDSINVDAIFRSFDKRIGAMLGSLNTELSKLNIHIDPKSTRDLHSAISEAFKRSLPADFVSSVRELNSSVKTLSRLFSGLMQATKSMGDLRKSGGGFDVKEFGPYFNSVKQLGGSVKDIITEVSHLKNTVKQIPAEFDKAVAQLKSEVKTISDGVRNNALGKVATARKAAQDDPIKFMRVISTELAKITRNVPQLQDTGIDRRFNDLSKNLKEFKHFYKALADLGSDLKHLKKQGLEVVLDTKGINQALNKLETAVSSIPEDFKNKDAVKSSQYRGWAEKIDLSLKGAKKTKELLDDLRELTGTTRYIEFKPVVQKKSIEKVQGTFDELATPISKEVRLSANEKDIESVKKAVGPIEAPVDVLTGKAKKDLETFIRKSASDNKLTLHFDEAIFDKLRAKIAKKVERLDKKITSGTSPAENSQANNKLRAFNEFGRMLDKIKAMRSIEVPDTKENRRTFTDIQAFVNELSKIGTDAKNLQKAIDALGKLSSGQEAAQIKGVLSRIEEHLAGISNALKDAAKRPGDTGTVISSNEQRKRAMRSSTSYIDDSMKYSIGTARDLRGLKRQHKLEDVYKYPDITVAPGKTYEIQKTADSFIKEGDAHRKAISKNLTDLSTSLMVLRKYIVNQVSEGLRIKGPQNVKYNEITKQTTKTPKWRVVRESADQNIDEYFKLTQGPNKKTSGKQWSFKIANTNALRSQISKMRDDMGADSKPISKDISTPDLIELFKKTTKESVYREHRADLGTAIGMWLKRLPMADVKQWQPLEKGLRDQLVKIKEDSKLMEGATVSPALKKAIDSLNVPGSTDVVQEIFKQTLGELEATKKLTYGIKMPGKGERLALTRSISIPAARLNPTGATTLETPTGSQRVLPKFAIYKTGFENLYENMKKFGADPKTLEDQYSTKIREIGPHPKKFHYESANKLAKNMLLDLTPLQQQSRTTITDSYKKAGILKAKELKRTKRISSEEEFMVPFSEAMATHGDALEKNMISIDAFINAMEAIDTATGKFSVSAFDAVKAMESVEFKNFYQMIGRIMVPQGKGKSPLDELTKNPHYGRSIREYEQYIGKLVGTIPIADPSRPRRYAHQEKIVNLMTMTTPLHSEGAAKFDPDTQKQYIRDLNLALKDFIKDTETLRGTNFDRKLPSEVRTISTLGVPDSSAGELQEFRNTAYNEHSKYLGNMEATAIKMYTDILPELSPFGGQFQQAGRNIASTTNALAFRPKDRIGTEFPTLRSARENEIIKGGRHGSQGYGFNVIAELRNTANTFEDQMIISGKLAEVLTQVTKTVVQPDALGRFDLLKKGNLRHPSARSEDVEDIQTRIDSQGKTLVDVMRTDIDQANRIFQEVLGVPQKYRGRADQALIDDIQKAVTVVRGQDLNVQTAKIAEVFFNHYGRKFTTRFGSKGVSVAPTAGFGKAFDMKADKIKVLSDEQRAKAGLGTAILPKSMGALASEIIEKYKDDLAKDFGGHEAVSELQEQLVLHGSKFMMRMFTDSSDVGILPGVDAELQKNIFDKTKAMLEAIGGSLDQGIEGIKNLAELHASEVPEGKRYVEKPIDIRISSFGAAKRGLQTESLETIMNNIISSGPGGATTLKTTLDPKAYRSMFGLEGGGAYSSLSEYSKALGFKSQGKSADAIQKDLMATFEKRDSLISHDKFMELSGKPVDKRTEKEQESIDKRMAAEEKATKMAAFEAKINYYSDIIDEFGDKRKAFVGPKFVEVIEDPNVHPAWSKSDIERQIKGERLNIPAYGAYSTIFGEDSAFLKQVSGDIPLDSRKHWEYLKSLQALSIDNPDLKNNLMKSAQRVSLGDLRGFLGSTGGFFNDDSDRDLTGTIVDTLKYPGPMKVALPSTKDYNQREDFYIPGALARGTYPEPLIAGERGMEPVTRRLMQVVNSAKHLDNIISGADIEGGSTTKSDTKGRIIKHLTEVRKQAENIASSGRDANGNLIYKETLTNEELTELDGIFRQLTAIQENSEVDPAFFRKGGTRANYLRGALNNRLTGPKAMSQSKAYSWSINDAVDQIMGLPQSGKASAPPEYQDRYDVMSMVDKAYYDEAELNKLAASLGVTPQTKEDRLQRALASLERAKIDYYHTLAQTALGKTGSIQETFFTRKVPSVVAKATTAVVDKTQELSTFAGILNDISDDYQFDPETAAKLQEAAVQVNQVTDEHIKNITNQRKKGFVTLKQHELGVSEEYAKKLPAEFTKKFKQDKYGDLVALEAGEYAKGSSLKELLEYREMLQVGNPGALSDHDKDLRKRQLDKELTPYIESVRFPFTGISSVQPYEAKLLKKSPGGRFLAKHTLMAPGVPEMDLDTFQAAKDNVGAVISSLNKQREEEWKSADPSTEKIEQLTEIIDRLNKAISDVIPKYIAHQQKLDFDGDTIQVHSAKTAEARREIEAHYKDLTTFDKTKSLTSQVFRDDFTYDATLGARSTGKYVFAEQREAFKKKFPEEEGFKFLEAPFLTDRLEYLSNAESLKILSNIPNEMGQAPELLNVIEGVATSVLRGSEAIGPMMEELSKVKLTDDKTADTKALMAALEAYNSSMADTIGVGIKDALYDAKYLNTVNAQLFKINTGQDTEGLNRILKVFERSLGFGGGVVGKGTFNPKESLKKMFPMELESLGSTMGNELNTMINELVRVGIQKGMDVKHAGETPIASEIVTLLSKGQSGASELVKKIQSEKSYGDLKEFKEANEKALGIRLGEMSTGALYRDAKTIAAGRGDDTKVQELATAKVKGNLDRDSLKSYIVESLGFESFLMELSRQIEQAAYEGILDDIKRMSPRKRRGRLGGDTPEDYAKKEVARQLTSGGIDIKALAEDTLMPLYQFRTSSASPYRQRGMFNQRYNEVPTRDFAPDALGNHERKDYAAKFMQARATAKNVEDFIKDHISYSEQDLGSYSMLFKSTVENIKQNQKGIAIINQQLKENPDALSISPIDRVVNKTNLPFVQDILDKGNLDDIHKALEAYSRMVGVPSLTRQQQDDLVKKHAGPAGIYAEQDVSRVYPGSGKEKPKEVFEAQYQAKFDEYTKKSAVVEQFDAIIKAAQYKASETEFLGTLFSKSKLPMEKRYEMARNRMKQGGAYSIQNLGADFGAGGGGFSGGTGRGMAASGGDFGGGNAGGGPGGPQFGGGGMLNYKPGDVVPVHIHSVAENAGVFLGAMQGLAETTVPDGNGKVSEDLAKRIDKAKEIVEAITGGLNQLKDSDYSKKYRASQLKGKESMAAGNFEAQVREIMAVMTARPEIRKPGDSFGFDNLTASSLIGTGIHARLQQEGGLYEQLYGKDVTRVEKATKYDSPIAGEVTGTIDVLTKSRTDGKTDRIIDIKTISPENFKILKEAVDKIKEETGQDTVSYKDVKSALMGKDEARYIRDKKLDEVASQLNFYLAAENKNAKAAGHFYDSMSDDPNDRVEIGFGFEPDRLNRDMAAIAEARKRVMAMGETFAKTGSFEAAESIKGPVVPVEDIDRLISIGREYMNTIKDPKHAPPARGMASKGVLGMDPIDRVRAFKASGNAGMERLIADRNTKFTGKTLMSVYSNLINLQESAKNLYQGLPGKQKVALSGPGFEDFHPAIQKALTDTTKVGTQKSGFQDVMKDLKEKNEITFAEVRKAWKAQRIAVGEFMTDRMIKARKAYEGETDERAVTDRYNDFQSAVNEFRAFIYDTLGKASDPYSYNRRSVDTEAAMGAGLYLTPDQLMDKASGPLGEDARLNEVFKAITTQALSNEAYPNPKDMAGKAMEHLINIDKDLIAVYNNAEKVARMGGVIENAWDFSRLREDLARLKHALANMKRMAMFDLKDPETLEYYDKLYKKIKALEDLYGNSDLYGAQNPDSSGRGVYGDMGLIKVPKDISANVQESLHNRNLQKSEEYYKRTAAMGGPKIGERFVYDAKVYGRAGQLLKSHRTIFHKYGESINEAGQKVSDFSRGPAMDLVEAMHGSNRTFKVAIDRVIKWGAAATLVYGGISTIKDVIGHMSEVEVSMAQLSMVMNEVTTDFGGLQKAAISFAKEYGVGTTDVLAGMKIFAQQGLDQAEVLDRTKTATLAANVTTLNASDATEALTAAMRVFGKEGDSSIKFLDAWSEVESKAAIKAGDLADAIKKAASAGKNAGFTFDQLNGMVAAVGSTTRQTGKEVGTSLRFIFRRLTSEKAPKELSKLGIPIVSPKGDLRPGFDILSDLAGQWDGLTKAQKMNLATSIGGTRQYNSVLVLMDKWDDVIQNVTNSINSKGSAERKNAKLMETYAKKMEQLRASFSELQIDLGKVALPMFKLGADTLRGFLNLVAEIPTPLKAVGTAAAVSFAYIAKGAPVLAKISELFDRAKAGIHQSSAAFKKGAKIGAYEALGFGDPNTTDLLSGLSTIGQEGANSMNKFHSAIGKTAFVMASLAKSYNSLLGNSVKGPAGVVESVGRGVKNSMDKINDFSDKAILLSKLTPLPIDDAIATTTSIMSRPAEYIGGKTEDVGKFFGKQAQDFLEGFAAENTSLVKAMIPTIATGAGLVMIAKPALSLLKALTQSAEDYRDSQYDSISAEQKHVASIRKLQTDFRTYERTLENSQRLLGSDNRQERTRRIQLGTFKSPITEYIKLQRQLSKYRNNLVSVAPGTLAGFDKFGNAILNVNGNLSDHLKLLEEAAVKRTAVGQIDVMSRYVDAATNTDGIETKKEELKSFLEEIPLLGKLLAAQLDVSPRKALQTARDEANKIVAGANKNPMTTAFNPTLKKLEKALALAREAQEKTVAEIQKQMSSIDYNGLSDTSIADLISSEPFEKAFKLIIEFDPKYNNDLLRGAVDVGDMMGAHIMTAIHSRLAGVWDAIPDVTRANVENMGILPVTGKGTEANIRTGDIGIFTEEFAEKYAISSRQALLKVTEIDDIILSYFDEASKKVMSKKFTTDELAPFVQAILPTQKIIESAEEDLKKLNAFVVGAAAGLSGIDPKSLTQYSVSLGERFFSDVDTTTLLQSDKGFNPLTGTFGTQGYKEDYFSEFKKYLVDPMYSYSQKMTELKNLRLEGNEDALAGANKGTTEEIVRLQEQLKNNQTVFQFRAAMEDLNKTLELGRRNLLETIEAEKQRIALNKESNGILRGTSKELTNLDLGLNDFSKLNSQQAALLGRPGYAKIAEELKLSETRQSGLIEQSETISKLKVTLDTLNRMNDGYGNIIKPKDFDRFMEPMALGADPNTAKMILQNEDILKEERLANTNLETLIDVLSTPENGLKIQTDRIDAALSDEYMSPQARELKIYRALNKISGIRGELSADGSVEKVNEIDMVMGKYLTKIAATFGIEKTRELNEKFTRRYASNFNSAELTGRTLRAMQIQPDKLIEMIGKFRSEAGGGKLSDTSAYKDYMKARQASAEQGGLLGVDSKTLMKTATLGFALGRGQKGHLAKITEGVDKELAKLKEQREIAKEAKPDKPTTELDKKIKALEMARESSINKASIYRVIQGISVSGGLGLLAGRMLGSSEGTTKSVAATAVGTYAFLKLMHKALGEKLPEYAEKFGKNLGEPILEKIATGQNINWLDMLGKDPKGFLEKVKQHAQGATLMSEEQVKEKIIDPKATLIGDKDTKDLKKLSDKAFRYADASVGESVFGIIDAVTTGLAVAGTGYLAKQFDTQYATRQALAKEEAIAIKKVLRENEQYIAPAFTAAIEDVSKVLADPGTGKKIAQKQTSSILKVEEEFNTLMETVQALLSKRFEEIGNNIKTQADAKDFALAVDTITEGELALVENLKGISEAIATFQVDANFGSLLSSRGPLRGYRGDRELPTAFSDMTAQQQLFSTATAKLQETIRAYANLGDRRENIKTMAQGVAQQMVRLNSAMRSDPDMAPAAREAYQEQLKALSKEYTELTNKGSETERMLIALGNSLKRLTDYQAAVSALNESLKTIQIERAVRGFQGMKRYMEGMDKLIGGSHPDAVKTITYAQERMGSQVGVSLRNGEATQTQIRRAEILKEIQNGNTSTELYEEYASLGKQRERNIENYKAAKEVDYFRSSMRPYEEYVTSLQRLKFSDGVTSDQVDEIDRVTAAITDAMAVSMEKVTVGDLKQELTSFYKDPTNQMSAKDYSAQMERLMTMGPDSKTMFRGIQPWVKDQYMTGGRFDTLLKTSLQESPTFNMREYEIAITDPIVSQQMIANTYLKAIAEKLGADSQDTFKALLERGEVAKHDLVNIRRKEDPATSSIKPQYSGEGGRGSILPYAPPSSSTSKSFFKPYSGFRNTRDMTPDPKAPQTLTTYPYSRSNVKPENYNLDENPELRRFFNKSDFDYGSDTYDIDWNGGRRDTGKDPFGNDIKERLITDSLPQDLLVSPKPFNTKPLDIGVGGLYSLSDRQSEILREKDLKRRKFWKSLFRLDPNHYSYHGLQGLPKYNTGGYVQGKGGPKEDQNLALLSNGEYVINAAAVRQIGKDNLEAINNGYVPPKNAEEAAARVRAQYEKKMAKWKTISTESNLLSGPGWLAKFEAAQKKYKKDDKAPYRSFIGDFTGVAEVSPEFFANYTDKGTAYENRTPIASMLKAQGVADVPTDTALPPVARLTGPDPVEAYSSTDNVTKAKFFEERKNVEKLKKKVKELEDLENMDEMWGMYSYSNVANTFMRKRDALVKDMRLLARADKSISEERMRELNNRFKVVKEMMANLQRPEFSMEGTGNVDPRTGFRKYNYLGVDYGTVARGVTPREDIIKSAIKSGAQKVGNPNRKFEDTDAYKKQMAFREQVGNLTLEALTDPNHPVYGKDSFLSRQHRELFNYYPAIVKAIREYDGELFKLEQMPADQMTSGHKKDMEFIRGRINSLKLAMVGFSRIKDALAAGQDIHRSPELSFIKTLDEVPGMLQKKVRFDLIKHYQQQGRISKLGFYEDQYNRFTKLTDGLDVGVAHYSHPRAVSVLLNPNSSPEAKQAALAELEAANIGKTSSGSLGLGIMKRWMGTPRGLIRGEGTGTSDSILARVSNGEFIINRGAAEKFGYDKLHHINEQGELPQFRLGGMVGEDPTAKLMNSFSNAPKAVAGTVPKMEVELADKEVKAVLTKDKVTLENTEVKAILEDNKVVLDSNEITAVLDKDTVKLEKDTVALETTEVTAVLDRDTVSLADTEVVAKLDKDTIDLTTKEVTAVLDRDTVNLADTEVVAKLDTTEVQLAQTSVDLNIDTATLDAVGSKIGSDISASINDAVNQLKNIKISVDAAEGGSVGADKFDQLAETVKSVNDQVLTSAVKFEDEVKRLDAQIAGIDVTSSDKFQESLNNVTYQIDRTAQKIETMEATQKYELDNVAYLAKQALDSLNRGRG